MNHMSGMKDAGTCNCCVGIDGGQNNYKTGS